MTRPQTYAIALAIGLLSSAGIFGRPFQLSAAQQPGDAPRFRVGVDAVRIDAVVTDRDGRIVSDLTAEDFEVRQDGKKQTVTFAQFMPVLVAEPREAARTRVVAPAGSPLEAAALPPMPVKREAVQRTLAIVVDDLSLSVESFQNTQRALHVFVERELQPTDLVALVRTGGSSGALQSFTTDRRVLHAAIDGLRWNGASRNGVEPFEAVNQWTTFDDRTGMAAPDDFKTITQLRNSMSAAGTLGALNLAIRGTRDLPGRKAIIFVSEGFQLMVKEPGDATKLPDARLRFAVDRVIDQATRAGVVIYSLDSRGLQTGGLQAADNLKSTRTGQSMGESVRGASSDRNQFNRDTQEGMAYLAEQTGGFAVLNTNDLARGLGRITSDLRGYYVIGYVPEDGTFAAKGKTARFRKIAINVKRDGLRVKTRKEFLGISDPQETAGPTTAAEQLVHAATSPFAATDIALRATVLPACSDHGMFVRALLHIDARALTFVEGEGGRKTASVDVLGMVFNQEGVEVGHLSTGFAVALTAEAESDALRDGLAYNLRIPIPRAGGYQVRFAVRDQHSGAMGSAGEFVDVDDMTGGAFALSGIVLGTDDRKESQAPGAADPIALTSAQSLRVYRPGTRLSYAYEIYNASGTVDVAASIYRETERVFSTAPNTLVPLPGNDRRFAAAGGLSLGEGLPPGSYRLVVSATTPDANRKGRTRAAVQQIGFDVEAGKPK
jgi:VWFA-related protein